MRNKTPLDYLEKYSRLTNGLPVAVRLFSNRSWMTSKCGANEKVAHETVAECITIFSLSSIVQKQKNVNDIIYATVLQLIIGENQSKNTKIIQNGRQPRVVSKSLQLLSTLVESISCQLKNRLTESLI